MYFKGEDFVYTFNGENKTKEEIEKLIDYNTTVSIDGLNINYFSPKKEIEKRQKYADKLAKEMALKYETPLLKAARLEDEKLKIEELRNHILNNNTVDKEFTDIIRLITADSEEELIVLLNELCDSNKIEKESAPKKDKIQEILKEADKHQAKNGGILRGVEFPFDYAGTIGIEEITDIVTKEREQKVIEDWNKPRPKFEEALKSGEQFKFNTTPENSNFGKKENNGKIDYSEIDFDILDLMANRFNANKHKYPAGNMLKPIEEKELLFALLRHLKKMIQPIETDIETFEEHLAAILCNAQMIYQQRKLQNEPNIYRRRSHK